MTSFSALFVSSFVHNLNFASLDAGTVCWDDHVRGITEILWLNAWGSVTAELGFLSAFRLFNLVKIVTSCSISLRLPCWSLVG